MTARMLGSLFSLALLTALPASAQADGQVASATGVKQVNGQTVYVDVMVAVPRSQTAHQATDRALAEQGARREKPPWAGGPGGPGGGGGGGGDQFFYTGLEWSSAVTQYYNPTGQPLSTAKTALTNTYSDWSNISGSTFSIGGGNPDTSRCPSLVQQCTGPQVTDGFNDVGWLSIGGNTLGVTWWVTGDPEADMALNTRFAWKQTCGSSGGSAIDLESVFLHENGHVAGLDHTNRTDSVMYPSYRAPRCTLYQYDKDAMANLYG
jgi:hypothetical protein